MEETKEKQDLQEAVDLQKEFDEKYLTPSAGKYFEEEETVEQEEPQEARGYDIEEDQEDTDQVDEVADEVDEKEDKSSKSSQPKSEAKAAKGEIPKDLLQRALKAGFDPDEAQSFKNPETLERILTLLEGRQDVGEKPSKAGKESSPAEEEENPFEYKITLDKDEYDLEDGLGGELNKLNKHYAKVLSFLAERLREMETERYTERFDAAIEGLGKEWASVFGEGSISDIERDSEYFKARQKLAREVETIQQGRARLGRPPLPLKEAVRWALRGAFEKEMDRIEKEKERQASRQRRKQTLARPANYPSRLNPNINYELYKIQEEFDRKIAEGGY